jgi:hypothetical protein
MNRMGEKVRGIYQTRGTHSYPILRTTYTIPEHTTQQTTQWPKEKTQKDKQQSTKHTYKTKDRVKRIMVMVMVFE